MFGDSLALLFVGDATPRVGPELIEARDVASVPRSAAVGSRNLAPMGIVEFLFASINLFGYFKPKLVQDFSSRPSTSWGVSNQNWSTGSVHLLLGPQSFAFCACTRGAMKQYFRGKRPTTSPVLSSTELSHPPEPVPRAGPTWPSRLEVSERLEGSASPQGAAEKHVGFPQRRPRKLTKKRPPKGNQGSSQKQLFLLVAIPISTPFCLCVCVALLGSV